MSGEANVWRLRDDGPGMALENMAVDQVLLESHRRGGGAPTLRFYEWAEPCLSLGAGQQEKDGKVEAVCRELGLTWVRRPTGGRAVLHGGDLTYSIVAGRREGFPASVTEVYRVLRRALQRGLARLGLKMTVAERRPGKAGGIWCFARGGGDLSCQGRKVVGSAQVWRGESFLQHGSLMLEPPEASGGRLIQATGGQEMPMTALGNILGRKLCRSELQAAITAGFEEVLGVRFTEAGLTEWERGELARENF